MKLSVIVPYANEWPVLPFTLRSIIEELREAPFEWELIAVDNSHCPNIGRESDRCWPYMEEIKRQHKNIINLRYTDKLSHWQAKNFAIQHATGDVFWFCDAHCYVPRGVLRNMFHAYLSDKKYYMNGTFHLPLTYHIMEEKRLQYSLVDKRNEGVFHYTFCSFRDPGNSVTEVPCMSTCGMMMHRSIYEKLGGWHPEFGIYGGGENFINFTMAVLGMRKWIVNSLPLHHHGEKRGYSWNADDFNRNRLIATYLFGGKSLAAKHADSMRGSNRHHRSVLEEVTRKCGEHREYIKKQAIYDIREWADTWKRG